MKTIEFEWFECTGRTLFSPINDDAKELCTVMRKKNLTEKQLAFCKDNGYKIVLRPRIQMDESLQDLVKYD